jgi:PAS domain S-box-containing protein
MNKTTNSNLSDFALSIIEGITDGLVVYDKEWNFLYLNDLAKKFFPKKNLIGKNIWKTFPMAKKTLVYKYYTQSVKTGKSISFEHYYKRIDKWFKVKVYPFAKGVAVYFEDITDQKLAQTNLAHSLEFKAEASRLLSSSLNYTKTLESVAKLAISEVADWCSVDLLDENNTPQQLVVVHKDPKKVKWAKKLREKNPIDMDASSGVPNVLRTGKSEFYPIITDKMLKISAKNEEQYELIKKLGLTSVIIVPFMVHKRVIGVMTLVTTESKRRFTKLDLEIAEQLATRAALAIENATLYSFVEKERERLENLIADVPGVVWEAYGKPDDKNQRINFVSNYTQIMLGYSVDHWLNTPNFWLTIVHPDDKERAAKETFQIYKSGKEGVSRFRWITKGRKVLWVEAHSSVIKDKNGKSIGMRGVTMDISDRTELEKRKDEFISIASHELKTPIATIKGFTQILSQYFSRDEKTRYYLTKLNSQVDRLTGLVNDLLDVSRIQSGKLILQKENFYIDELIKDTVEDIQTADKSHKLFIEGDKKIIVSADKFRISQVLINLISNAIKYSPKSDKVLIKLTTKNNSVLIYIRDFGIGISKKNIKNIFEPFFQAENTIRRSHAGLGLGLHISKEIIERHQGIIKVQSQKKKGSVFSFSLPLTKSLKNELPTQTLNNSQLVSLNNRELESI